MTSKRKLESDKCEEAVPKFTWAINAETTLEILNDIGVSLLESDNSSSYDSNNHEASIPKPVSTKITFSRLQPGSNKTGPEMDITSPTTFTFPDNFRLHKRSRPNGPRGRDYFSNVSDEVMLKIFQWLPKNTLGRCAAVCQRFRRLTNDESLWRRLDLGGKHINITVLSRIIDKGLLALRLAKTEIADPVCHNLENSEMGPSPKCSRLQFLDLSMASVTESTLAVILKTCSQLKRLSLENCVLNDEVCGYISTNPAMTHLNLAMCQKLSAEGVTSIAKGCQNLESINLAWTSLTADGLNGVVQNIPDTMKRINISGCRTSLKDEHVEVLVQRCQNLLELDVSDACKLTDEALQSVVDYLPRLKRLAVSRCYGIPAVAYIALQQLPDLISFEIFGVLPDNVIESLRLSLPKAEINTNFFSTVARPTTGIRRTSIWGLRVRD